jgi:hypothetical protein
VRRTLSLSRAGVAGAAAVILLAACGGDDGGESATDSPATASPAESSAAETTATSGAEDFCTQAAGIDERVDSALSDLGGDQLSVPDAFRRAAEEVRAIDAPGEIATDWEALAGGLDRIGDALSNIDITDPESLATLEDVEGDLSTASTNVENYLRDECGIDTPESAAPTPT